MTEPADARAALLEEEAGIPPEAHSGSLFLRQDELRKVHKNVDEVLLEATILKVHSLVIYLSAIVQAAILLVLWAQNWSLRHAR